MVCPKCISHNPDGAETCHWCGNTLRQEQGTTLAETVVACVACGSQLKTSANFCSQCGAARLPFHEPVDTEPELACAACGGSINPGANYCKWCGLAVANASGSTGSVAEPTRQALRQAVVPRDKGDQRQLAREQQRIAEAQRKQLIQEQSAARKEAWRTQAEEEKERAREAAEERTRLAEERRLQKAEEQARVAEERRLQKAEERAQKEAERRERERIEREAQARERPLTRSAKEEDDFDVASVAKLVVQFAPGLTGGKVSPEMARLVTQVLEEFQRKSDDTSASAILSHFNQVAIMSRISTGTATDRDMAMYAVSQFLKIYRS